MSFFKAQSTQPKKPQKAGPVNIFRTTEPQGPSPLRGATVRTVHCFHSTAQPQESVTGLGQVSSCGCGGRVGGGSRPVTTAKDGSLRAQAVNPDKKWWNIQGKDPQRVRDAESETRYQTKESVTPPKETSSQKVQSTWPVQ